MNVNHGTELFLVLCANNESKCRDRQQKSTNRVGPMRKERTVLLILLPSILYVDWTKLNTFTDIDVSRHA